MSRRLIVAVDGGGSKTDLALADEEGALLACLRGPLCSPQLLGFERSLEVISELLEEGLREAGLAGRPRPFAEVGQFLVSGLDYPAEEEKLLRLLSERGWAANTFVSNDTFAVLRAGSAKGWGVAVVCGAGINCVAVAPDGRRVRFPALGQISGDWGGGYDLGLAALAAAVRSEDGRGPKTSLEKTVPDHFDLRRPLELVEAIHFGRVDDNRLTELAPLVLEAAAGDPVAAEIVDRLAAEVVAFARAAIERLDLASEPPEVLLGGGILQAGCTRLREQIEAGLSEIGGRVETRVIDSPPLVGAALLALDQMGVGEREKERLRKEITSRLSRI